MDFGSEMIPLLDSSCLRGCGGFVFCITEVFSEIAAAVLLGDSVVIWWGLLGCFSMDFGSEMISSLDSRLGPEEPVV